jgi:hypothetical protein
MEQNIAARSHLRVTMADGAEAVDTDPLADLVVDLVLEAMGVNLAPAGGNRVGPGPFERPESTRVLAARRAAPVVDRLELLTAVVRSAQRYRRAVSKGKGKKKARKKLFESLEAWQEVRGEPGR